MKLSELNMSLHDLELYILNIELRKQIDEHFNLLNNGITTNKGTTGNESENRGQGERDRGEDLGDMDSQGSSKV